MTMILHRELSSNLPLLLRVTQMCSHSKGRAPGMPAFGSAAQWFCPCEYIFLPRNKSTMLQRHGSEELPPQSSLCSDLSHRCALKLLVFCLRNKLEKLTKSRGREA